VLTRTDGRLSQEGRLLRTLIGLVVLCGALVFGPRAFASDDPAAPVGGPARTYVVAEGETLWGIAGIVAPGESPDVIVAEIARLNHLSGSTIVTGQQLLVPVAP